MASPTADDSAVAAALNGTLAIEAGVRQAAETSLSAMPSSPQHAASLLRLTAGGDHIAAAAALRLKNAARAARTPGACHAVPPLEGGARAYVRENLLAVMAVASAPGVHAALAEALRWLVLLDFPARWGGLMGEIMRCLDGGLAEVWAALAALHKIGKCYEFRSNDPRRLDANDPNDQGIKHPREPLDRIVEGCFPGLLRLFLRLAGGEFPQEEAARAAECMKLIVKVFWCSMQFVMPPHLAEPGVLEAWFVALVNVFEKPVVLDEQAASIASPEDLAAMPQFKIKKWIGQVLLRFLRRYSNPKRAPFDEPHTRVVAIMFQDKFASRATASMLHVLAWPTQPGGKLSGRVANLAIDFLQEAVETAALWAVLLPHIHLLLSQIIFPYLCFSQEDADLWEEDPVDYVRKQTDIAEDYTSPRMAANSLLSQLGELRPKNTVLPFMTHLVSTVLEPYLAAAVGSPERAALARQKVGAMMALNACKLRLMKADLAATFLDVLTRHVEPDVRSEFGFLRAAAHKLLGDIASSGWEPFIERLGESSLRSAVAALEDPELPVSATAGGALHFLMEQDSAQPLIGPFAPQLLERLLVLMDKMSDGYVTLLPTLDKLVDRYPDQLMPLAVPLMRRLVSAFHHSSTEAKNQGDDDEGDEDLMFQAAQMLQLISSVLTTAGEWTTPSSKDRSDMFAVIESELQPVLLPMFENGNQVFAEETLDVLHTLVLQTGELNGKLSPLLMSMVPRLVKSFESWSGEYVSSDLVGPIEAYIAYDFDALLGMEGAVPAFMSIAQRLWKGGAFDDSEAVDGTKIADALILGLTRHSSRGSDVSNRVVVSLAREAARRCSTTTGGEGPLRVRIFGSLMLGIFYDAALVVREFGGIGPLMELVSAVLTDIDSFTRVHDKKAVVLGLSAMIGVASEIGLDGSSPGIIRGILGLQELIDRQRSGDEQKNAEMSRYTNWANSTPGGGHGPASAVAGGGENAAGDWNGPDSSVTAAQRSLLLAGTQGLPGQNSGQADDGDGTLSELDDDEDASHRLLDDAEGGLEVLEKLSAETGIPVAELELMNANGGSMATTSGLFDFEDLNDDDDEGDNPTSALDSIDEVRVFVDCAKAAQAQPWWPSVPKEDCMAIELLSRRVYNNQT